MPTIRVEYLNRLPVEIDFTSVRPYRLDSEGPNNDRLTAVLGGKEHSPNELLVAFYREEPLYVESVDGGVEFISLRGSTKMSILSRDPQQTPSREG